MVFAPASLLMFFKDQGSPWETSQYAIKPTFLHRTSFPAFVLQGCTLHTTQSITDFTSCTEQSQSITKAMLSPSTKASKSNHSPAQREWLARVDRIITSNLKDTSFVIAQIAMRLFVSERQFYRKLKKLTGKTPNQYIRKARMLKAREIIRKGYKGDLNKLAKMVGYQRADYFSSVYYKHYGVRPNEEIKNNWLWQNCGIRCQNCAEYLTYICIVLMEGHTTLWITDLSFREVTSDWLPTHYSPAYNFTFRLFRTGYAVMHIPWMLFAWWNVQMQGMVSLCSTLSSLYGGSPFFAL